jgi:hypothetical protein
MKIKMKGRFRLKNRSFGRGPDRVGADGKLQP